jgi:hypothetical protein
MTRFTVFIILLLALSVSAFAQARKPMSQRLSVASRDFTVTAYGAIGDGQVATDCSITVASNHVICTANHFQSGDVGKVFALYGAGQLRSNAYASYRQPLAGTIIGIVSATEATVSVNAQADVTNSERFVWGTNNTAAIRNAIYQLSRKLAEVVTAQRSNGLFR